MIETWGELAALVPAELLGAFVIVLLAATFAPSRKSRRDARKVLKLLMRHGPWRRR